MPLGDGTLDVSTEQQIDRVRSALETELGDSIVGVYLHGSAVQSSLRPTSDIDLLVVTRQPPSPEQQLRIVGALLPLSGSAVGARPVEVTIVDPARPDVVSFQYGEWNREDYEAGVVTPAKDDGDIVVVLAGALAANLALSGPSLEKLIGPVDSVVLRQALSSVVPGLLADAETDTRNVILTLARIAYTLATGRIAAKDTAATWAAERLSSTTARVLADAAQHYSGCGNDVDFVLTGEQLQVAVRELRELIHQLAATGAGGQSDSPVSSGSDGSGGGSVG